MSPRLPRDVSGLEVVAALKKDGGQEVSGRSGTAHRQLKHPDKPGKVTVPIHRGENLLPKTLKGILSQADMTTERLLELL